jgi:hypothetical protein
MVKKPLTIGPHNFSKKGDADEFLKTMLHKYDVGDKVSAADADYCTPRCRFTRTALRKWGPESLISASGARTSARNASGSIVSMAAARSSPTEPASTVSGGGVLHFVDQVWHEFPVLLPTSDNLLQANVRVGPKCDD